MAFASTPQSMQFATTRTLTACRTHAQAISAFCDELRRHCRGRKVNILQVQAVKRKIRREEKDLHTCTNELMGLRARIGGDLRDFEEEVRPVFDEVKAVQFKLQRTLAYVDERLAGVEMTSSTTHVAAHREAQPEASAHLLQVQLEEADFEDDMSDEAQVQNAREIRALEKDMGDLVEIFENVMGMVQEQGQQLDDIAANMSSASQHVAHGTKELIEAGKMRSSYYPLIGAVVGGVIGGPVGMWAGLKIVGLTTVAGAGIGTLAGSWLKSNEIKEARRLEQLHETTTAHPPTGPADKKRS